MKRSTLLTFLIGASILLSTAAPAAAIDWAAAANGNWNNGPSWVGGTAPGSTVGTLNTDTANFPFPTAGNTATYTVTVDSNRNVQNITFPSTANPTPANGVTTLSGGNLLLSSGGTLGFNTLGGGTYRVQIDTPIELENANASANGAYTFITNSTVASKTLTLTGGVTGAATSGSTTLTLATGTNAAALGIISGNISDGSAGGKVAILRNTANAAWILSADNTYSGATTISNGILQLGGTALNSGATATGWIGNSLAGGGLSGTGGTIVYNNTSSHTISTNTSLSNTNLNFLNGKLVLSGTNTGTMGAINVVNTGAAANGWFEIAAGANYTASSLNVASGSATAISMHMTGGTLNVTGGATIGGSGFNADSEILYMSNGSLSVGGDSHIGGNNPGNQNTVGIAIMSGGTFTTTGNFFVGTSNNGGANMAMGGGTVTVNGSGGTTIGTYVRNGSGSGASLFLAGNSTFATQQINRSTNSNPGFGQSNTVYFNGGTLKALTNSTNLLGPRATPAQGNAALTNGGNNVVYLFAGGATIDSNGFNVTANPDLVGDTASATANASSVGTVTLATAGSGYSIAPNVTFSAGPTSGTTATGFAQLDANGSVSIIVTNPGMYATAPTVTISGGTLGPGGVAASGTGATVGTVSSTGGGLTKTGTGTLTVAGMNAYTGPTKINGGVLSVSTLANGGFFQPTVSTALNSANVTTSSTSGLLPGMTVYSTTANINAGVNIPYGRTIATITGPGSFTLNSGTSVAASTNVGSTIGFANNLGLSSSAASNLILNGGTLQYTGVAVSTDRLFSVGTSNGGLDASGSGALDLTNTGAMGFNSQTGSRTLTLTGTNTGDNFLRASIGDNSGATSLTKTGAGTWVLTNSSNAYTGATTVNAGTLKTGASNVLPDSSAVTVSGTGAAVTATLDLNGNNDTIASLDLGGSTTTSAAVVQTGAGTLTLAGNVSYSATNNPLGASISGNLDLGGGTRMFTVGDSSSAASDVSVSAVISNGALTKAGAGTQTLTASNTYSGTTTVSAGTLAESSTGFISDLSALTVNGATAIFDLGANHSDTVAQVTLDGGGQITGSGTSALSSTVSFEVKSGSASAILAGTGIPLNKTTGGTVTLSGNNSYTGNTTVSQGTLGLSNANNNNISGSPLISLATGSILNTTALGAGPLSSLDLILASGQTLKGTGTIVGNLTVTANSTIAPGNSPGTLSQTGTQTWAPNGNMEVEINNATGTSGSDPGWDLLAITGSLDVSGLSSGNEFEIDLVSLTLGNVAGLAVNFADSNSYAWRIVNTSNVISTYTGATQFTVDTSGFANPFTGTFSVLRGDDSAVTALVGGADDTELYLYYQGVSAVPEPGTWTLAALGLVGLSVLAIRRRKNAA